MSLPKIFTWWLMKRFAAEYAFFVKTFQEQVNVEVGKWSKCMMFHIFILFYDWAFSKRAFKKTRLLQNHNSESFSWKALTWLVLMPFFYQLKTSHLPGCGLYCKVYLVNESPYIFRKVCSVQFSGIEYIYWLSPNFATFLNSNS